MKKIKKNPEIQNQQKETIICSEEKGGNKKILMTPKEMANYMGLGVSSSYELVKEPDFPKIKIGKKYFIMTEKLDEWLEAKIGQELLQNID